MNKKRIIYNILSGFIGQLVGILIGLIIPRLIIINFGSQINGLLSSLTQIYACLALLEAGVGTATWQALYFYIAKNDKNGINGILSATNIYYKKIAKYYLLIIIVLSLIYQPFLARNIDYFTVFVIVFFTGLGSVFNFWFYGKYNILLHAEGKSYIITNLNTIINIISSIVKVLLVINGINIILIQVSFFIVNLIQLFYISYIIKKDYPWINLKVSPNFKAISQKNSVLIHEITAIIFNNTDIIYLSIFSGLEIVSIYTVYNYFFKAIHKIVTIFLSSTDFALGKAYNSNKDDFLKIYEFIENYFLLISFIAIGTLNTFIIPFMKLYTNKFADANYILYNLPILFSLIEILTLIRRVPNSVIGVAGHFKQTQNYSIIESTINVIFSLILVIKFNIYGVLIATIISLLYRTNNIIMYSNKKILNRNPLKTYSRIFINTLLIVSFTYFSNNYFIGLNSYYSIIYQGLIYLFLVTSIGFVVNSLCNKEEFKFLCKIILSSYKKYIKKIEY